LNRHYKGPPSPRTTQAQSGLLALLPEGPETS
jgi:hypothetical protein